MCLQAWLEGFERVVTVLDHPEMTKTLDGFNPEPAEYDAFIEAICPFLIKHHSDQLGLYLQALSAYYRSPWAVVRANAAIVVGNLIRNVPLKERRRIDLNDLCSALMALLNEPSPLVRNKAAKALSFLHDA